MRSDRSFRTVFAALAGALFLPFPGVGHLRAEGKGYAWVPLTYNTVR